jgi:hypothetical protein
MEDFEQAENYVEAEKCRLTVEQLRRDHEASTLS